MPHKPHQRDDHGRFTPPPKVNGLADRARKAIKPQKIHKLHARLHVAPNYQPGIVDVPVYSRDATGSLQTHHLFTGSQAVCVCGWRSGVFNTEHDALEAFRNDHLALVGEDH